MTTGFGFCANCGTPRLAADQKFCAVCGSALAPAPQAPVAPAAPPAWSAPPPPAPIVAEAPVVTEAPATPSPEVEAAIPAPPAPEPAATLVAPPPPPPAWSAPPPPPPAYQAAPPPPPPAYQYAPPPAYQGTPPAPGAARTGLKITPLVLLIGVVVLAVIAGAFVYMNMSSKAGSMTFTPPTLSCSNPVTFTVTAYLPSSVHAGDKITITLDGKSAGSTEVANSDELKQQTDGSWIDTSTTTAERMKAICASGGSSGGFNVLTPGLHTMQILDSTGTKVLASGSYTVTP
jgi:hypothetical protein